MKHLAFLALFLVCSINAQHTSWSWNEKDKTETLNLDNGDKLVMSTFDLEPSASEHDEQVAPNSEETKTSARSGRNLNIGEKSVEQSPRQGRILGPNPNSQDTLSNEAIIDEIIANFGAQSRSLEGYDEVYADPGVQEALQSADEAEARNVIRDRLCYLQLMKCDDEEINGKNPYIAPEELQYAQPVAINPVGRPIPTIPLKGGKGMYGPPRPAYSSGNKYGPPSKYPAPYSPNKPPRRNYGPPPSKPFYGPPGPINKPPFLSGGEILAEGEFLDKPPSAEYFNKIPGPLVSNSPYQFDQTSSQSAHHKDKRVEIHVNAQGGVASVTGAPLKSDKVEHVHHHYHHNADEVKQTPTVIVNPVPIAAAAVSSAVSSSNSYASSNGYGSNSGSLSFGSGLGGSSSNYASSTGLGSYESSGFKPTYETGFKPITENYGPQTFGNTYSSGLYGSNSNSFGATAGYYGNTGLYKKELNIDSGNSNYLEKYQGVESARAENYDCVCVPYDQCPVHDVIGKRDDLFLAIDPRNLKSDIEALPENETVEAVVTDSNGNMTVVRVPKETNKNETAEVKEEIKKISKREISAEPQSDDEQKVEGRQYGAGAYDNLNNLMKKIKPTFGISLGLPYQGGGGYPYNPHNIYPNHGTVGATGINLGLVSVNPLVSVQVTKDDYGNKVIKPFVNLHLTPNSYLINKFEDLVSYKKHHIFNKHVHYHKYRPSYPPHHHVGYEGPYRDHPAEFHHGHPIEHGPHFYGDNPINHDSIPPFYNGPEIYNGPPIDGPLDFHEPSFHPKPFYEFPDHHNNFNNEEPNYHSHNEYFENPSNYGGYNYDGLFVGRSLNNVSYVQGNSLLDQYQNQFNQGQINYGKLSFNGIDSNSIEKSGSQYFPVENRGGKSLKLESKESQNPVVFPTSRRKRDVTSNDTSKIEKRQAYYSKPQTCGPRHVCCKRPFRPPVPQVNKAQCGTRHSQGINGRIKTPAYVDGDSEFGEYPWQAAILRKDPKESVYVCGGTLIDPLHIITAAHCVKQYTSFDLRVRLGEWDVNHDVEFYPYIERDVSVVTVHPEFYAGTLYNDLAILRMDKPVDWSKHPHISPACLPHPQDDYSGSRCWTTGWGKDAFGDFGKYQNILKEVDVPVIGFQQCQRQLQNTRLGYEFKLHPGFVCAGGEEGKDSCKGDGGGPMVCERGGTWQVVGVVSWGIGCGQRNVPGVYVRVAHYLDWIRQVTQRY